MGKIKYRQKNGKNSAFLSKKCLEKSTEEILPQKFEEIAQCIKQTIQDRGARQVALEILEFEHNIGATLDEVYASVDDRLYE